MTKLIKYPPIFAFPKTELGTIVTPFHLQQLSTSSDLSAIMARSGISLPIRYSACRGGNQLLLTLMAFPCIISGAAVGGTAAQWRGL